MPQLYRDFDPLDPLPANWTDAWQAFLSTSDSNFWLRIKPGADTVLEVPAGAGAELVGITIQGSPRYIEASVERASPGGGVARDLDVWVTSTANSFAAGSPGETDLTNYAFALAITETGVLPGGVAIKRKVGTARWDGAKFTSVTPSVGRPSVTSIGAQEAGAAVGGDLAGTMPNPTIGPFPAGRVLSWGGDTTLFRDGAATLKTGATMKAGGGIFAAVGLAEQVYMGVGAAGIPTILLGSGLDVNLYRSAASTLRTDGNMIVGGIFTALGSSSNFFGPVHLATGVIIDWNADTSLYRLAAGQIYTPGVLVVGSAVTAYEGTVARIQIGNASGVPTIYMGLSADTLIQRVAAGRLGVGSLDLSGSLKRPMLTALPGSPYDGQEILLQTAAMVTAGMRPWHLRYNAAGGTYKWEVLGGASHAEEIRALQAYGASTGWENLATPGPDITVPLAGEYIIEFGAGVDMQTLPPVYRALLGVGVGGGNASDADCIDTTKIEPTGVGAHRRMVTAYRKTVAAAGRIRLQYRCDVGAALAFDERWLKVTPLRVG